MRAKRIARGVEFAPARNRASAYSPRSQRRWKTISIWRSKKFQQNAPRHFHLPITGLFFSRFPRPCTAIGILGPLARTSLPLPDVPFSSTYCANSSNVATTAILDGHSASEERKRVRRRTEEPESGKNKLGEDEPESKRGAARRGN